MEIRATIAKPDTNPGGTDNLAFLATIMNEPFVAESEKFLFRVKWEPRG